MTTVHYLAWAYPSPVEPYAGPFFRTQAEALARLGVNVRVIAPVPWANCVLGWLSDRWRVYCEIPREQVTGGVHVEWPRYAVVPSSEVLAVAHHFMRPVIRRAIRSGPVVLHAHGAYPLGFCCARYTHMSAIPTVLTVHGGDINVFPTMSARLCRHVVSAVQGAAHVIAVSHALAKKTELLTGVLPEVLPLGVDAERFRPALAGEKMAQRRALGLSVDRKLVLYVGSLYASKGISELCSALRDLTNEGVQGVFVGDGPLRSAVAAMPSAVHIGRVSNDYVRRYMVACDLLVLPSHSEGLPTVLVEAGMIGLPVLATEVGGIPELLGTNRGVMVRPRDPRSLCEAMRATLADSNSRQTMAQRLHEHVRKEYDASTNAVRLAAIYAELAQAHRRTSARATCARQ